MKRILMILSLMAGPALGADAERLDELFTSLENADETSWEQIENKIWSEWSESGSPAMDLLLQRGREATTQEDYEAAIEHLTALVENAPEFAEGWNARATAYYAAGLVGPALHDIAKTLELEPRHFGALSGLGRILEETGNDPAALEAYSEALTIHPHRPSLIRAVERLEGSLEGKSI
ncbi:MAG: tetratricopeptide repeat protein [Pseudomonadota bacterium]|nr:tetratricopeptide repeat protein [Pseudomonadota bacterium]